MTFELHIWVILGFPFSSFGKHFFWSFFFRLVLFLGFQARLMLETYREYCLEQIPSFFFYIYMVFGAHLMEFRKLGLILVFHFMRFFMQFLGLD